MLKRPKFLKILINTYLVYAILFIVQFMVMNSSGSESLTTLENLENFSTNYFKYYAFMFDIVLTVTMFYYLLALRAHGWLLQILFSFFNIFASLGAISNNPTILLFLPFCKLPYPLLVLWVFFNAYVIYYFFTPNILSLFFNSFRREKVKSEELISFLHATDTLREGFKQGKIQQTKDKKICISPELRELLRKKQLKENVDYLPVGRVLISEAKTLSDIDEINELNKLIERKARKIISFLSSILPSLKEREVIDQYTYDYYKHFSWHTDDVIKDFKIRAIKQCEDKRQLPDKLLKYSKKVDECELLKKTNQLMESWLTETGNELGDLVSIVPQQQFFSS